MRPAEFIRPKQTKIWPHEGRNLHWLGLQGKISPMVETHNSVCPRFCMESELNRMMPLGDRTIVLVDLL